MSANEKPTYVTVVDNAYFLGAVALVNSLRITGNAGTVLVIDAGLTNDQRDRLSPHCEIRPVPVDGRGVVPSYFKPTVAMLGLHGVVVFLDSDMIVTGNLEPLYSPAAEGAICVFPDGMPERRFEEWQDRLALAAPVRRQPYVNTGFVAVDFDRWAVELHRWWQLCERAHVQRSETPWGVQPADVVATDPFLFGDQDVLNAILMSEVAPERVRVLDEALVAVPHWPHYDRGATIVDRLSLRTVGQDKDVSILHYWAHPKPWFPGARRRLVFGAYVELLARLLTADDVPISLPPALVPLWLRDDLAGKAVRRGPRLARRTVERLISVLPESLGRRVRSAAEEVAGRAWR